MLRKTVIVTGGFGDTGKAVAKKFAENHYNIALTYYKSFDSSFLQELKKFDVDVLAIQCNQDHESEIINFANSVFKEFEYVDACVCTAGVAEPQKFLTEKTADEIDKIIQTNLRGTILFNREIAKHFITQKHGAIVNISSIYGEFGGSMEAVYSACKAGLNALTKSLAQECAPFVRVNAVAPGFILTKMTSGLSLDTKEYSKNQIPLARLGSPEDVAKACYFLASDESSYITGQVLNVSGGATKF